MEIRRRHLAFLAFLIFVSPLHAVETGGPEEGAALPAAAISISAPAPLVPAAGADLSLPPAIDAAGLNAQQPAVSAGAQAAPARANDGVATAAAQPQAAAAHPGAEAAPVAPQAHASISVEPAAQSQAAPAASGARERAAAGLTQAAHHGASGSEAPAGAAASFEQSAVSGGRLFDGLRARARQSIAPVAARLASSRYARFLPARLMAAAGQGGRAAPPAPPAPPKRDRFGGPLPSPTPSTLRGNLAYGLKAGGVLLGLSTVLQLTLGPLVTAMPWQLHAPHTLLEFMGRVELLTTLGPAAILHALKTSPLGFFLIGLPWATFREEVIYRGIQFVLIFSPLAAVRFLATKFSGVLDELPDLYGFRSALQRLLGLAGRVSGLAFPIAAVLTSFSFATAHFPLWGATPYSFGVHFLLGLALTYIAYTRRSLTASWSAHLVVNALPLFGVAAALALGSPVTAALYALALSIGSIVYLMRVLRAEAKAKAWTGLKRLLPLLVLAACLAGVGFNARHHAAALQTQDTATFSIGQKPGAKELSAPGPVAPPAAVAVSPNTSDMTETQVSALIKPSVVKITVQVPMGEAIGSGFIVSKEGLLVTNNHVVNSVKPGTKVEVELSNGQTLEGTVVADNADRDIALVQLPKLKNADGTPADWPFLKIADMSTVHEGDHVVAAGHPLDLPYSVSHGIVSGLGQRGSIYVQQLQTDAAINHGNSGGPLVNMRGEVVGINTSIAAPTPESGSIGIGFSITADGIKASLAQYAAQGNIDSADLGIIVNDLGPQQTLGIQIEVVRPGSAAEKAGLRAGDVILGVNGDPLAVKRAQAIDTLAAAIAKRKPGDRLDLDVYRRGAQYLGAFTVQLGDKKPG